MENSLNDLVIKHNDLIEARYDLNLVEQKIILLAVTKIDIDKDRKKFNLIRIKVNELVDLMNTTNKRYTEFREIANGLMDRKVFLKDRPNLDVRWLSSSEYIGNGIIELEFSEKLIPYLIQLKNKFTRYQLKNILYLKNKYAIRMYELLKQYENIRKRPFELDEFKKILMIEGLYERSYDLERFVLKPAVEEINLHTDINISYEKIKKGRIVTGLIFKIVPRDLEEKIFIEYLKESYNIEEMKEKMGLVEERFNTKQVIAIYEMAVQKTQDLELDIFEYVHLNYLHMIQKGTVRNKYSYLLKSLEDDYARAAGQIKVEYIIDEEVHSA